MIYSREENEFIQLPKVCKLAPGKGLRDEKCACMSEEVSKRTCV